QLKPLMVDFTETIDGMGDKAEEYGVKFGEIFMDVGEKVKGVVNWFKNLDEGQQLIIAKVGAFAIALGPLLTGFGILGGAIAKVSSDLGGFVKRLAPIVTHGKGVASAAGGAGRSFTILRTVMTALTGPVGIVIAIISGLATAFITAYKKSETFRNFIQELGNTLKETFNRVMEYVQPAF